MKLSELPYCTRISKVSFYDWGSTDLLVKFLAGSNSDKLSPETDITSKCHLNCNSLKLFHPFFYALISLEGGVVSFLAFLLGQVAQ